MIYTMPVSENEQEARKWLRAQWDERGTTTCPRCGGIAMDWFKPYDDTLQMTCEDCGETNSRSFKTD